MEPVTYNEKQLSIMEDAVKIFAQKGYDSASVRDIARISNINVAMISYYFGSKEKLLEAIFNYYRQDINTNLRDIVEENADNPEQIEVIYKMLDLILATFYKNKYFNILLIHQSALTDGDGAIFKIIQEIKLENKKLLETVIGRGQAQGEFRQDVDVTILYGIMIGSINQVVNSNKFYVSLFDVKDPEGEEYYQKVVLRLGAQLKAMIAAYLCIH